MNKEKIRKLREKRNAYLKERKSKKCRHKKEIINNKIKIIDLKIKNEKLKE